MGKQLGRVAAALCLLCFMCFFCSTTTTPGQTMVLAAEGKQAGRLLMVNRAVKGHVNRPLGTYKANNDYIEESNQKRGGGPQHSNHSKGPPPSPSVPKPVPGKNTTWCVVKPSTSEEKLDDIINYCCTQPRVNCTLIQPGGMCYFPPNKVSDASVVMNMFYSLSGKHTFDCFFKGSGVIVSQDPSVGKCIYQV